MFRILYTSRQTGPISEAELQAMMAASRERNRADGISGMLLADDQSFLQLLEGEAAAVKRTYERIERHPWHTGIEVLLEEDVAERLFADWSMGYARMDGIHEFALVDEQLDASEQASHDEPAYRLLCLFRRAVLLPAQTGVPLLPERRDP